MTIQRTVPVVTYSNGRKIDETTIEVDATADELHDRARQALQSNRDYLALSSPTAAQSREQVERLTRQVQGLIRLVIGQLDDVD